MSIADRVVLKHDLAGVDFEQLAELYRRAYRVPMTAARKEKIFRRSYATCIALLDGRIVGAGYALSDGELDATIHGLAVLPELQRRGIGMRMMKSLLRQLEGLAIILTAEPEYQAAYRRLGFRPLKTAMAIRFPEEQLG